MYILHRILYSIYYIPNIVHCIMYSIYHGHYLFTIWYVTVHYTVCNIHHVIYNVQYTMYSVHCTLYMYTVYCTVYSVHGMLVNVSYGVKIRRIFTSVVHCKICDLDCTMYIVQCTQYNVHVMYAMQAIPHTLCTVVYTTLCT